MDTPDKVDSTRAAAASPGALQNIGSYITGTIGHLSAHLQESNHYISANLGVHPSLIYTAAAVLLAAPVSAVAMSRYGWSRSPYSSQPGGVPTITEDDYAYITSQDLDDAGVEPSPSGSRQLLQHTAAVSDNRSGPDDVLIIKSRGVNYPIKFPARSIGDGKLQVRDVTHRAGLMMNLSERRASSLRFLFKGRQLKDQNAPVRDYGIKNNAVLMAILPEGDEPTDGEDEEMVVVNETSSKKKKGKKGNKKRKGPAGGSANSADDSSSQRGSTSNGGARSPEPPAPGALGQRRIDELADEFKTKWLPLCQGYIADPPADARKRTDEHTKLSETIFQHILLKLDEVEPEGNPAVRQSRKDLVKTVQAALKELDVARGPAVTEAN